MTQTRQDLSQTVREVAATRVHKLAPFLVSGEHEISPAQFYGLMRHLRGCPVRPTPEENMARHDAEEAHKLHAAGAVIADITAGFYATPSLTGSNDLDFWKVTEGRNPGIRFVKRVIGGGDTKYPHLVEISRTQQFTALSAILRAGIDEAREEYADKETRCMKCGAQLTDDESRARRMGPKCRGDR